jgi:predicted Zn-dependent protease with MMP-like domain
MERADFESFVIEAVKDLPKYFKEKMENISIIVEDFPSFDIQKQMGHGPYGLLGIYQGVPYRKRGFWYGNVMPDKIIIFQKPIENIAKTDEEIKVWVRKVVMHEIGHYYGLSEDELRKAGV